MKEAVDLRRLSPSAQEALGFRVVRAVLGGMSQSQAARIFGVSVRSVNKWMVAYRNRGEEAIRGKPRGRPRGGRISNEQADWMIRQIRTKCLDELGLPFVLWTREAVGALLEKRFSLRLGLSTLGRYLRKWGMSPQKPVRRALEKNPAQVRYWLRVKYPAIVRQAKAERATVYWADEMGLRSDHSAGRSFSPKGKTPVVTATGNRFSCNMISGITNLGKLNFMIFEGKFSADVFLEFLRRLLRTSTRKVFLIVDRHLVHRSRKVGAWLTANDGRIKMFFLPGYSPELNPTELLNQDVKSNSVGRQRAGNKQELMRNVRGYLRSRQRTPQVVRNYFLEENVRYAA